MRQHKNLLYYITTIVGFSLLIYYVVTSGKVLETGRPIHALPSSMLSHWDMAVQTLTENLTHPLSILLLQIVVIIVVARFFAFICQKIGQPTVIGEILAGIFLGPSFFGHHFPELSKFIFPAASLGNLQFLSQIGLVLFMFIVGMELDLKVLKNKAQNAIIISHASIVLPFALGMGLAYYIYKDFAPEHASFLSFALFLGIAMSITAFPVLARIVQERGLSKTKIGAMVITCAAADDITAWCLLAAVIAVVKAGTVLSSLYTIAMAVGYVLVMFLIVRPFYKRLGEQYTNKEYLSKPVVGIFFIMLFISAYTTETIGIHALFGAFVAGVIMPTNISFRNIFVEKVEDVSLLLLLPLFFVFTGLRTEIGLLNEPYLWKVTGFIILVAVVGKFVGSALSAKFVGQTWRESLTIGALMNTRGLMELVVLNIGYDLGVLGPTIFAMMILMALTTTFMTGPALSLIGLIFPEKKKKPQTRNIRQKEHYKVLLAVGNPHSGKPLIRLALGFTGKEIDKSDITVLHLSPSSDLNPHNIDEFEKESFRQIKHEAKLLDLPVTTMFKAAGDIEREISHTANQNDFDLLLIGVGPSIYEGTLLGKVLGFTSSFIMPDRLYGKITGRDKLYDTAGLGDRTIRIMKGCDVPVGVFLNNKFEHLDHVLIPFINESDSFLLDYAERLLQHSNASIALIDLNQYMQKSKEHNGRLNKMKQTAPERINLFSNHSFENNLLPRQCLMIISFESWKQVMENRFEGLSDKSSILIIKNN